VPHDCTGYAILTCMTRVLHDKLFRPLLLLCGLCMVLSFAPSVAASPFGQGVFGAQVPFGAVTSLTIALGGNVNLSLTPSGATFTGSGSHTITVTSTDAAGYALYIYSAGSTALTNGAVTLPASGNSSAAPLATNTWGYNIDASSNYIGLTATPVLLKTASGPYESGDNTTVTYGVLAGASQAAGNYTASVTYTAVALNE